MTTEVPLVTNLDEVIQQVQRAADRHFLSPKLIMESILVLAKELRGDD